MNFMITSVIIKEIHGIKNIKNIKALIIRNVCTKFWRITKITRLNIKSLIKLINVNKI